MILAELQEIEGAVLAAPSSLCVQHILSVSLVFVYREDDVCLPVSNVENLCFRVVLFFVL
jgi:hypothetical protein